MKRNCVGRCLFMFIVLVPISAIVPKRGWGDAWPAIGPLPGANGRALQVDRITIRAADLPVRANLKGFMIGPHLNLVDAPYSSMLMTAQAVLHPNSAVSKGFVESLRRSGCNAVRHYDAYWHNPLGGEATLRALAHFQGAYDGEDVIATWGKTWPTGFQLLDFFAERGFDQSLVVPTIYYDPATRKVYETKQVCDDVDGVVNKAAEANTGVFARHWREKGFKTRLILEIGNEGIGYGKDPPPGDVQYAKLCRAYIRAIKAADPNVEVAVVGGRLMAWEPPLESPYAAAQVGVSNRRFLRALGSDTADQVEYIVPHLYDMGDMPQATNRRISDITAMLDFWRSDLDACGFKKTRFLITEYRFNLWNRKWQTAGMALAEAVRMMQMVAYPGVAGIFMHNTPGCAFCNYSDGATWTLTQPPGEPNLPVQVKNGHIVDTRPDLGPRYRILPTGFVNRLMAETCRGELLDEYAMTEHGQVSYLLTRGEKSLHLLVANLQATPLVVNVPDFVGKTMEVYAGQTIDAVPADTIEQPYGISKQKFNGTIPAYSLCLIPLKLST